MCRPAQTAWRLSCDRHVTFYQHWTRSYTINQQATVKLDVTSDALTLNKYFHVWIYSKYIYVNCVHSCARLVDYKTRKIFRLRIEVKPTALLHHAHKLWPLAMTLTYNPKQTIMIVTFTHKTQVQKWVGSKDRVEINGRTGDGRISTHADPTSTRRTTMCSGAKE